MLDFEVWANDELITTQWDEEDLDQEERKHLAAQRQSLLADQRGILRGTFTQEGAGRDGVWPG